MILAERASSSHGDTPSPSAVCRIYIQSYHGSAATDGVRVNVCCLVASSDKGDVNGVIPRIPGIQCDFTVDINGVSFPDQIVTIVPIACYIHAKRDSVGCVR